MWLFVASALAGSGPWVIGPGTNSAYLGIESQRITRLATAEGSFDEATVIDVDEGLTAFGAKAIVSYGFLPRVEGEVSVPWKVVYANRTDGPLCTALGDGCDTTRGVGIITAKGRWMWLDEVQGAPLTLTGELEARFGQLTAATRNRVTNLGEGSFDVGPAISAGHVGGLGEGYWSAYVTGGWRYRFPTVERQAFGGEFVSPGSEWHLASEATFAPGSGRVSFGPGVYYLWRPQGLDVNPAYAVDPDWLGALSVLRLSGGGTVNVRAENGTTLSVSVFRNLYAVNNPTDALLVSAGITLRDLFQQDR